MDELCRCVMCMVDKRETMKEHFGFLTTVDDYNCDWNKLWASVVLYKVDCG